MWEWIHSDAKLLLSVWQTGLGIKKEMRPIDPNLGQSCAYISFPYYFMVQLLCPSRSTLLPHHRTSSFSLSYSFWPSSSQPQFLIQFNHHPFVISSFVVTYEFVTVDLTSSPIIFVSPFPSHLVNNLNNI